MADKSFNITISGRSTKNVYFGEGNKVINLQPFEIRGYPDFGNYGHYYMIKDTGPNNTMTGIFGLPSQQYRTGTSSLGTDVIRIWPTKQSYINNTGSSGFFARGVGDDQWRIGLTNYSSLQIPNNSIVYFSFYTGYKTVTGNPNTIFISNSSYYIDNIEASGLYFEKGKTYQFIQTGSGNKNNPLNIYLDEYGNKKLTKYVTINGTAGVNRYITVSIPKSFKETKTLYYGNESGEFFGAPIKLISTDYYLKHNVKILCFGAYHDGVKYYLPENILDGKFLITGSKNYVFLTTGIYPMVSDYINSSTTSSLYRRKDTLSINLNRLGGLINTNFSINYFGNKLTFKRSGVTGENDWSNLHTLYYKIGDLSFGDSGSLDKFSSDPKSYYQYGYRLSGCEGCIEKINITTGEGNIYSGIIDIYYNPLKIINNNFSNPFLNISGTDIIKEDFITFDNIGVVNYSKSFYQDTVYNISNKI